jgi:hypothetical protein
MTKLALLVGLLLCLAAPAYAQLDEESYTFVVYGDGILNHFLSMIATPDGMSVGPIDDTKRIDLGRPDAPWHTGFFHNKVRAAGFVADGRPGLNTVIHLGACVITIQGGLIVSAVQSPFNRPCR